MAEIGNFITSIAADIKNNLSTPLIITAMLVAGICFLIPSEEFHAKAVKIIPYAIIGFALIMTCVEVAANLDSHF